MCDAIEIIPVDITSAKYPGNSEWIPFRTLSPTLDIIRPSALHPLYSAAPAYPSQRSIPPTGPTLTAEYLYDGCLE